MYDERFSEFLRAFRNGTSRRVVLAAVAGLVGLHQSGTAANRRQRDRGKRGGTEGQLGAEAKPGREVTDLTDDFTIDTCSFPVQIHQKGKAIELDFGDRLLFAVPGAEWTLTNPETGASTRLVIPGPELVKFNEDGTVTVRGTGPWAWGRRHPVTHEARHLADDRPLHLDL